MDTRERSPEDAVLQECETFYQTLVESIPEIVWMARADGTTAYLNPHWFAYTGADPHQIPDDAWNEAIYPEDRNRVLACWKEVRATDDGVFKVECRLRGADGRYRWFLMRALPKRGGYGLVLNWFGTCTDIDEQKLIEQRHRLLATENTQLYEAARQETAERARAAEALQQSEARFHQMEKTVTEAEEALHLSEARLALAMHAADIGMFDSDLTADAIVWSEGHHTLFGMKPGEFDGRYETFAQRIHPEDLPALEAAISCAQTTKTEYQSQFRVIWPDGSVHWIEGRGRFFYDEAGVAVRMAGVILDVTAQRRFNEMLVLAYDDTIEGWARALDLRDKETVGHTRRVTTIALRLARRLGLPTIALEHLRRGALLHDIGKMGIPDRILLKPDTLTADEWEVMRRHTDYARDLLEPIEFLRPAMEIPYCHHERWDGSGYPLGLKGEEIPLAARIFAVVDVWDALRSDRPYRPSWSAERVRAYIRNLSGIQFDPTVVEAFLSMDLDEEE